VRRPVRSFIKEYKNRSMKPAADHPRPVDADNERSKPSFLEASIFAVRRNKYDDERKAALAAADAVFGGRSSAASIFETAPSSDAPGGRILPSLIDEDDALAARLTEADEKIRRDRRLGKAESSSPTRRKKATVQPKNDGSRVSTERPAENSSPEISIVSAPRLEHRSIRKRWVLETELKAGEKWKRRLCKAAR
jgi:hypothetical protein